MVTCNESVYSSTIANELPIIYAFYTTTGQANSLRGKLHNQGAARCLLRSGWAGEPYRGKRKMVITCHGYFPAKKMVSQVIRDG